MALTNAQKQRRFGDRNVIVLTDRAEQIAEKLFDMEDQKKLRRIAKLIGNYLKNPNRSGIWAVDLGYLGNGRMAANNAAQRSRRTN